jgi:hypothetical protein
MKKKITVASLRKENLEQLKSNKWQVKDWDKMGSVVMPQKILQELKEILNADDICFNNTYQCRVRRNNDYTHLEISRHDNAPMHNWQHIQQIKNDICGEECEGIELYPAMGRIVDFNNHYHLWVLEPGKKIEVGFRDRMVVPEEEWLF